MIARLPRSLSLLGLAAAAALASASCQKVPLLAPSGSTITLTASATTLPVSGSTVLIAQVVEAAGTVPHSGTRVTFTTTLGTIQPDAADTDVNGQARAIFTAGTTSGTATITATSGGAGGTTTTTSGSTTTSTASNSVKIAIGAAAVGHVGVTASPATVPAIGGDSTITANVLDTNGSPLTSVAVSFSTTAGNLSSVLATTDASGLATTVLHTSTQAVVTASVGTGAASGGGTGTGSGSTSGTSSGTVTVIVAGAPSLIITPPTTAPGAGLPAAFTFAVTAAAQNGSAVRDVSVNWGDGTSQDLGAFTGSEVVNHVYQLAGTYVVAGTLTDASGYTVPVSTSVSVVAVPFPTIVITPTVPSAGHPVTVTFNIQVTTPTGVSVQDAAIDFGDGSTSDLGGLNGTVTLQHTYTAAGSFPVKLTVTDTLGRTTTGSATVTVS